MDRNFIHFGVIGFQVAKLRGRAANSKPTRLKTGYSGSYYFNRLDEVCASTSARGFVSNVCEGGAQRTKQVRSPEAIIALGEGFTRGKQNCVPLPVFASINQCQTHIPMLRTCRGGPCVFHANCPPAGCGYTGSHYHPLSIQG